MLYYPDRSSVMMNLPIDALSFIPWKFEFENSRQGDRPRDFWQSIADAVVAVGEFIVGIFVAIGDFFMAIWDGIVSLVGTILLAVLEFLAYILWCLVRAALLILIWIAFGITVLFLTIGIAAIAVALIPISLIFGASMYYTLNSVGIDFPGFSFGTGYDTGIENYEAFDIPVPYINGWFALGDNRIIDVTINFWPPEFEFNSEDISYEDDEVSESLSAPNIGVMNTFAESFINFDSLKTSTAWDWEALSDGVSKFLKGFKTSRDWWTIAIPFGIAGITLPSEIPTVAIAKYTMLIIAFTSYITGFITEFIIADLDDNFQVFWFMLGAGIMSISTGVKFYKNGKPKIGPQISEKLWEERLEEVGNALTDHFEGKVKGLVFDLISVFVKDILDEVCDIFEIPTNGYVDLVYSEFVRLIKKAVVGQ